MFRRPALDISEVEQGVDVIADKRAAPLLHHARRQRVSPHMDGRQRAVAAPLFLRKPTIGFGDVSDLGDSTVDCYGVLVVHVVGLWLHAEPGTGTDGSVCGDDQIDMAQVLHFEFFRSLSCVSILMLVFDKTRRDKEMSKNFPRIYWEISPVFQLSARVRPHRDRR